VQLTEKRAYLEAWLTSFAVFSQVFCVCKEFVVSIEVGVKSKEIKVKSVFIRAELNSGL
jgi:hypothetical protein